MARWSEINYSVTRTSDLLFNLTQQVWSWIVLSNNVAKIPKSAVKKLWIWFFFVLRILRLIVSLIKPNLPSITGSPIIGLVYHLKLQIKYREKLSYSFVDNVSTAFVHSSFWFCLVSSFYSPAYWWTSRNTVRLISPFLKLKIFPSFLSANWGNSGRILFCFLFIFRFLILASEHACVAKCIIFLIWKCWTLP